MSDAIFHIVALAVAAWGVIVGYRQGLTGLVTSVLGMAFGIVCSHIFAEGVTEALQEWVTTVFPQSSLYSEGRYLASNLGCGAVYFAVYFIFRSLTGVIRNAMESLGSGLLNSILGTLFCVVNYLLMLSIVYNIYVGMNPESPLMRHGQADDGNICSAVMAIGPACLGSESFDQFAHERQLRDARKISCSRQEIQPLAEAARCIDAGLPQSAVNESRIPEGFNCQG